MISSEPSHRPVAPEGITDPELSAPKKNAALSRPVLAPNAPVCDYDVAPENRCRVVEVDSAGVGWRGVLCHDDYGDAGEDMCGEGSEA